MKKRYYLHCSFILVPLIGILLFSFSNSFAQTLAFPGAEGFGRFAQGARGVASPSVYVVTNLNDSGPGSFRDAVSQPGRVVVFAVGGIVHLNSRLVVSPNTTIAGQTAPGDGIVIYGRGVSFSGASNTITRFIRFRCGVNGGAGSNEDAVGVANGHHMIFDHVSASWGVDEVFSINWDNKGIDPDNITLQNCIIGQGVHRHNHSAGGLMEPGGKVSIIKSLYFSNKTRNPKVKGINEFVNNIVYNFGNNGNEYGHTVSGDGYIMGGSASTSHVNIINNYFIGGPHTPSRGTPFSRGTPTFNLYASGNYWDNNKNGVLDGQLVPFNVSGYPGIEPGGFQSQPYDYPYSPSAMSAEQAFDWVMQNVGATYPRRDEVDALMISELASIGTAASYVYRESDLPLANGGVGEVFNAPAHLDSDGDGIPDYWEDLYGLNKNDKNDAVAYSSFNPEYLNIEVYINSLIDTDPPAFIKHPTSVTLSGSSSEIPSPNSTVTLQWVDNSENENRFVIERSLDGNVFAEIGDAPENSTSYTDSQGLLPNTTYYYRIKAEATGTSSAYSPTVSLRTPPIPTAPDVVTSPYPLDEDVYIEAPILTLRWTGSTNTTTYKVYIGKEASALNNVANVGTVTYQVTNLEGNTQYYWRVDAENEKGTATGEVWSFTTQNVFPKGMVGYWSFDETVEDGNHLLDSSPYENHGLLGLDADDPDIRVPGKSNNALDFSSAREDMYVVRIPDQEQIYFDKSSFSISLWMKAPLSMMPPDNNTSAYLFCKGSFGRNATIGTTGKRYNLEFKNKQLRFAIDDDNDANGGGKDELSADATSFFTDEWVHVVLIRDAEENKLKLYRNGSFIREQNITKAKSGIGEVSALIIGNIGELEFMSSFAPAPYKGMLDELKIYNFSLTDVQVADLYHGNDLVIEEPEEPEEEPEEPEEPVDPLEPLQKVSAPFPAHDASNVNTSELVLEWSGNADKYRVYVGLQENNLPLRADDVTETSFVPLSLATGTTYFWKVDAVREDEVIEGDVWKFQTATVTSIQTNDLQENFTFYPNPSSGKMTIEFFLEKPSPVVITLYDGQNRLIKTIVDANLKEGTQRFEMDVNNQTTKLSEGIYYCVMQTSEKRTVRKVVFLKNK